MRKLNLFVILLMFLIVLSSCKLEKTYFDLRSEFETHLEETKTNYVEKINNFNNLTKEVSLSVVKIDLIYKHGTGVIFQEDEDHYYILTNAHIMCSNYCDKNSRIYDAYDNSYTFDLVDYSLDFDLAIIKMPKNINLKVITFANFNSPIDSEIIIYGYHESQKNAVTYGKIALYDFIEFDTGEVINIKFPTMISSNPVKHGSSGSVVINNEGLLVGLLYAGSFNDSNTASFAFSIPVERIIEFLGENDFTPIFEEELS